MSGVSGDRAHFEQRIIRDPQICGGEPVFKGTRVTLRTVLASLAAGDRPTTESCSSACNRPSRRNLIIRTTELFEAEHVSGWAGCFVVVTERKIRVKRPGPARN